MHCSNLNTFVSRVEYKHIIPSAACGIALCVAGIFLTLVAYQVIPIGVNTINAVWGQAIGFSVLAVGCAIVLATITLQVAKKCLVPPLKTASETPSKPSDSAETKKNDEVPSLEAKKSALAAAENKSEEIYSVETVIGRIKEASENGLKTALFLGRRNNQEMPEEKEWAWFSLDEVIFPGNQHHHLQINFNDRQMGALNNLFDKVVVDTSVIKSIHVSPWRMLQRLLKKLPSSELIVESDIGGYGTANRFSIDAEAGSCRVPPDTTLADYEEHYQPKLWDAIQKLLETLFYQVERKKNAYPYRNEDTQVNYWRLTYPRAKKN